jgi:hypothetical protein
MTAKVPGQNPALLQGLPGHRRFVPGALHDPRSADPDIPDRSGRHVNAVLVLHRHMHAMHRRADGSRLLAAEGKGSWHTAPSPWSRTAR